MFHQKEKKRPTNLELQRVGLVDENVGVTPDSDRSVRFNAKEEDDNGSGRSSNITNRGRLSRGQSIQRGFSTITRKTMGFVSINEDLTPEQQKLKQQKWMLLRQRHLDKFGKKPTLFSSSSSKLHDATDRQQIQTPSDAEPRIITDLSEIVRAAQTQHLRGGVQTLPRKKRESAAVVLWKAGVRSISTRPRPDLPTFDNYGGRSFAPSDLATDDDGSVFASSVNLDATDGAPGSLTASPVPTPSFNLAQDDYRTFFEFSDKVSIRDEPITPLDVPDGAYSPYLSPTREVHSSHAGKPAVTVSNWDPAFGPEPVVRAVTPSEIGKLRTYERGISNRGNRLGATPELKKKKKKKYKYNREFGKGMMGNFLNRTLNRQKITSHIEQQFEEVSNHRPYFTYWLSFVQVVIMIVMLALYPLAPMGVKPKTETSDVIISRSGVLMKERVTTTYTSSFWIGPSIATLIKLGAKYAPCMRKDKEVFKKLDQERLAENSTGCCIEIRLTGCIQRKYDDCSSSSTNFHEKKVCGLDPQFCMKAPIHRKDWDLDTITKWPICWEQIGPGKKSTANHPWMKCTVTGRPCCVKNQGQCIITTKENCDFHKGTFHSEANLCSQVDCLQSTCGMLGFTHPDEPDQFYRLILSLFLNAGILHVLVVLVFNFTILRDIEIMAGCFRTSLIFILSGIGGNLWSSILIPYEPEVGELGASFGILSCLFVEVIQSWSLVKYPMVAIGKLTAIMLILLFVGLLPYIDNFAHIFGFIYGFFLSLIILPYVVIDKWDERRKQIQTVVSFIIIIALTVVGFILFYNNFHVDSKIIQYLNCVPIIENFCNNFHLGSNLEDRVIEY